MKIKTLIFLFFSISLYAKDFFIFNNKNFEFNEIKKNDYVYVKNEIKEKYCTFKNTQIFLDNKLIYDFYQDKKQILEKSFGNLETYEENNTVYCRSFFSYKKIKFLKFNTSSNSNYLENNDIIVIPESRTSFFVYSSNFQELKYVFPSSDFNNSSDKYVDLIVENPNEIWSINFDYHNKNVFCLYKININFFNFQKLSCINHDFPITSSLQHINEFYFWVIETSQNNYIIYNYDNIKHKFKVIKKLKTSTPITKYRIEEKSK